MALVLIPLIVLGGLELALRLAGFGYSSHFFLADRVNGQRIVRDNQQFCWRFFPPVAARTPQPVVFSPTKPPKTCRVFVFGESAAYGDPAPAFGLTRFLEVLLRNRYPGVHFEIINVAMTAINSNVILPIARDCASEDGDVWVVYMGNNEVVGPYGGGTVFGAQVPPLPLIRASIAMKGSKLGQVFGDFLGLVPGKKSSQPTTINLGLFLDQKLRHDDPRMEKVYAHFTRNLEDIVETGIKSGVKVVVSTVASNLKDCAPFASLHGAALDDIQRAEWERLYQKGTEAEQAGNLSGALEAYGEAAKIDDQWADLHFRLGRVLWKTGDFAASLRHYTLARDYDALRFRADTRINDIIGRTCSNRLNEGVAFLDGNAVLAQNSPHGIPGRELLYEHVHLNFTGNYRLARAVAGQITGTLKPSVLSGPVPSRDDWLSEEECTAQLGLNDWDRLRLLDILSQRLENAPFTLQLTHEEQHEQIKKEIVRCRSLFTTQKQTVAIERCQQALLLDPADWLLHQKFARLLEQLPDQTLQARAIEEWRQVIAQVPHYPEAHYELGVLLDKAAQAPEAEAQLRLALTLKRNCYPNALNALGHVLAGQNRLPEAVENYEKALQLNPDLADALVNLGVALNRLGKKAEAKARLEEALRLAPGRADAAGYLGQLLNENGEVSAAIARHIEALRTDPNNASTHYRLAECLNLVGRASEAQEHYAEALRIQPDFAEAHCRLGVELAKSGKDAEALAHFREAVRLKPYLQVAHKSLGIALARQQKFDEAIKHFEEALRLDPGDVAAQKFLQAARRSLPRAK